MERDERLADHDERGGICVRNSRQILPQRHDRKDAEDADGNKDAFDDPGRDKSKGEDLVHPLEEREQHDSAADVRDDEEQL